MTPEEQYQKDAEAAGLDIESILADKSDVSAPKDRLDTQESEPEADEKKEDAEEGEKDDKEPDDKDTLKEEETPKVPRKRSVYDDLKSEKQKRKDAEAELERLKNNPPSKTEEANQEEKDELEAYATENNLDPVALKKMRELFLKGVSVGPDEQTVKKLEQFEAWRATNEKAMEKTAFDNEFSATIPQLKEYFPSISDAEMEAVKAEVDKIAHSKEWHDKDLDYVLFKNQEVLGKLITPHKRTLESKGRKDVERSETDFNPSPDLANMTPTELSAWEANYRTASRPGIISTDSKGKQTIL